MDIIAVSLSGAATLVNVICIVRAYRKNNTDAFYGWLCAFIWSGTQFYLDLNN